MIVEKNLLHILVLHNVGFFRCVQESNFFRVCCVLSRMSVLCIIAYVCIVAYLCVCSVFSRMCNSVMAETDALHRICVAYPWSQECSGLAPIVPTDTEQSQIWSGPGGLVAATGTNIPNGTRCESVQLIPIDAIGKRAPEPPAVKQDPNSMYMQIRGLGDYNLVFCPKLKQHCTNFI